MTINDAILQVMAKAEAPLSPKEAYGKIIESNLYTFHAQSPVSIVRGQIRRHCIDLDFATAHQNKLYSLTDDGRFIPLPAPINISKTKKALQPPKNSTKTTQPTPVAGNIEKIQELQKIHTELVIERIITDLKKLPPQTFEYFSKRILEVYGIERVTVTAPGADGGIDGFGELKVGLAYMQVAFQSKRWKNNIGLPLINEFRGAIQGKVEQGVYFTTSEFTKQAKAASIQKGAVPIILIDGRSIAELMIEKEFGIQIESIDLYSYALDTVISDDGSTI